MNSGRKGLLYGLYVLMLTAGCAYLLFPSEAALELVNRQARQRLPAAEFTLGRIRPTLPPGLRLADLAATLPDGPTYRAERAVVYPVWPSLIGAQKALRFSARAYAGRIQGRVTLASDDLTPQAATARASGLSLETIPLPASLESQAVSGTLNAELTYEATKGATVSLRAAPCILDLTLPVLELAPLEFRLVEAELALTAGSLRIKQCRLQGSQLDGELSGTIALAPAWNNSRLDLKGTVKLHHVFLASLKEVLPADMLPKTRTADGSIPLTIGGTPDKPRISFR